jgi:NTE family protein
LQDGGLVNPVPVTLCRALGADIVIAVNLNRELVVRNFKKAKTPQKTTLDQFLMTSLLAPLPKPWLKTASYIKDYVGEISSKVSAQWSSDEESKEEIPNIVKVLSSCLNIMQVSI